MKQPSRLERGSVLGGRYHVIRKIGTGGMSHVYLAEDLKLPGKKWAVKENVSRPEFHGSIVSEAETLITLQHSRLPHIVDFFAPDEEGYSYLVMDFIDGITLQEYLHQKKFQIPVNTITRIIHQIMEVLDYLHGLTPPMIYRDLKPSNIMIAQHDEIRLIDFGIARKYKLSGNEDTVKLGTIGFAAPEQFGSGQTDARSDLYSLGALFLYMSTRGAHSEWIAGVEQLLRNDSVRKYIPVMRRLLRYEPQARYQSIKELREEMYRLSEHYEHGNVIRASGGMMQGTRIIALIGTAAGAGVTHTAIAISHYLARLGSKVAVIEMSKRSVAFSRIKAIAYRDAELMQAKSFDIEGVHYVQRSSKYEMVELLGGSYQYVVLDLGSERDYSQMEEFFRSDLPIVVNAAAEWKQDDIASFLQSYPNQLKLKWTYLLPLASKETVNRMRKRIDTPRVYSIPPHVDPFDRTEHMDEVLQELLDTIKPISKRRRFLFKKA